MLREGRGTGAGTGASGQSPTALPSADGNVWAENEKSDTCTSKRSMHSLPLMSSQSDMPSMTGVMSSASSGWTAKLSFPVWAQRTRCSPPPPATTQNTAAIIRTMFRIHLTGRLLLQIIYLNFCDSSQVSVTHNVFLFVDGILHISGSLFRNRNQTAAGEPVRSHRSWSIHNPCCRSRRRRSRCRLPRGSRRSGRGCQRGRSPAFL